MSDIKLVVLKTGEQIVGKVNTQTPTEIRIEHPIMMVQVAADKMGFMEYVQITEDTTIPFSYDDVRHVLSVTQDVANYWNQQYGSGIQIVTNPAQVLVE
jgi:hypothetical protein